MLLMRRNRGFTLVEILIVLVILAILVAVALPSYQQFGQRSRRGDAKSSLLHAQLAQEKWRADATTYGALADIWSGADSLSGYYTIAVSTNTGAAFVVIASPKAGGPQVGDECGVFAVNQDGPIVVGGTYANSDCWER